MPKASDFSLEKVRLLVLDDDENTRTMLAELLRLYGATAVMAQNAEDAQRIMKQASVHLVLSDIGLPGIDGYEFMRAFRRNSAQSAAYVPAIAVTGYAQPDDERLAREAGYDAFLAKPLDIDKLVSLIAQLTTTTP